jgi:hypothetical protein
MYIQFNQCRNLSASFAVSSGEKKDQRDCKLPVSQKFNLLLATLSKERVCPELVFINDLAQGKRLVQN